MYFETFHGKCIPTRSKNEDKVTDALFTSQKVAPFFMVNRASVLCNMSIFSNLPQPNLLLFVC